MSSGIIYCITNAVSGKRYVGKTSISLEARWSQHRRSKSKTAIACALRKYGAKNFVIEKLATADTREALDFLERAYISALDSRVPNGYNLRDGGDGGTHSPQTIAKMRGLIPLYKDRQREALRRFWADPKNKKRMIETLAEIRRQNYADGKRHKPHRTWSAEAKKRHSEQRKKLWGTPEYRAKLEAIFSDPEVNARRAASVSRTRQRQRLARNGGNDAGAL